MPIEDAANINATGVLISSTNLNTLALSDDKSYLSVGPGPRWGDVFTYLNGTDLMVVGGRLGPVGVSGLLLGGGMSFYSFNRGLASAGGKIKAYEVCAWHYLEHGTSLILYAVRACRRVNCRCKSRQ